MQLQGKTHQGTMSSCHQAPGALWTPGSPVPCWWSVSYVKLMVSPSLCGQVKLLCESLQLGTSPACVCGTREGLKEEPDSLITNTTPWKPLAWRERSSLDTQHRAGGSSGLRHPQKQRCHPLFQPQPGWRNNPKPEPDTAVSSPVSGSLQPQLRLREGNGGTEQALGDKFECPEHQPMAGQD